MRKKQLISGLVALAVVACAIPAFAQEKAFTENANVLTFTNITLTSPVVGLGVGKGGNVRSIQADPATLGIIYVLPSTSATATAAITNQIAAGKGVFIIGNTNQSYNVLNPMRVDFGRGTPLGYWSKYIYVVSPNSNAVFSYTELGR